MKKVNLLYILFFVLFAFITNAQNDENIEHQIQSTIFNSERTVHVFIPKRYYQDTSVEFAVCYILDAQSNGFWEMAKSNIGYLVSQYQVLPMIVVGIVSDNRNSEFAPKGTNLTEHLKQELFPLINKEYRVSDYSIIVGHSWGGAFVGNKLFSEDRDMFDAYIGISPSLHAGNGRIFENAVSMLSIKDYVGKYFYCSSGDVGNREFHSNKSAMIMDSIINLYPNKTLNWKYEQFANTGHWSCVIPSLNHGLLDMSRNCYPDDKILLDFQKNNSSILESLRNFYKNKKDNFGYAYQPGPSYWRFLAISSFIEL